MKAGKDRIVDLKRYSTTQRGEMIKSIYRSSLWLILLKSLPIFILTEAFLFRVSRGDVSETLRLAVFLFGLMIVPALLVLYILYNSITIQITGEEIRFSRLGKNYLVFPVASRSFSAYKQTETIENIIRLTARFIRVTDASGNTDNYRCYGFSKESYERLISELQAIGEDISGHVRPDLTADGNSDLQRSHLPFGGVQFVFPRDLFSKTLLHGFLRKSIGSALIFLTLGAAGFAAVLMQRQIKSSDLPYILTGVGVVFLPIAVIVLCLWFSHQGKLKKIPGTIRVTDSALQIDDLAWRRDEIFEIKMTSENAYIENDTLHRFRKIKIRTAEMQRTYLLGHIDGRKNCFCYPEYSDLYKSINAFLRPAGKNVIMITY